jgi:hypothetical protein
MIATLGEASEGRSTYIVYKAPESMSDKIQTPGHTNIVSCQHPRYATIEACYYARGVFKQVVRPSRKVSGLPTTRLTRN